MLGMFNCHIFRIYYIILLLYLHFLLYIVAISLKKIGANSAFASGLAGATLDFYRVSPWSRTEISQNPALQVCLRPKLGYFLRSHGQKIS